MDGNKPMIFDLLTKLSRFRFSFQMYTFINTVIHYMDRKRREEHIKLHKWGNKANCVQ